MKEIIIVYQDCPMCGARKEWGEKTIKEALNAKAKVRKVSFVTREGEKLCYEAVMKGIKRLPFVTDGKTYAYDVKTLLEGELSGLESKPKTQTKKKSTTKRKTTKRKTQVKNESD